jgi:hypothetical protein
MIKSHSSDTESGRREKKKANTKTYRVIRVVGIGLDALVVATKYLGVIFSGACIKVLEQNFA